MKAIIKQAFITAVTAVSCLYLAQWLKLPQGFWAVMSAIVVLQSDAKATISASWMRVVGTFVGALVGGLFLALCGIPCLGLWHRDRGGGFDLRAFKVDGKLSHRCCDGCRCHADGKFLFSLDNRHLPFSRSFFWYPGRAFDLSLV